VSVRKLFWEDPYLAETSAVVSGVDGDQVTVDRTVAFALSGGQESDAGIIGGREILRADWREREIVYTLPAGHGLRPGDEVLVAIDWPRRYRIMRLHFAAELVLELVYRHFGRPEKIGAHISAEKARLDFRWDGSIAETFPVLEREVGRLVDDDLPIASAFDNEVAERRSWEVEGFARVPCGGTHLRRTGEVGRVRLRRDNIGGGKERVEIRLAD
jgi:Ser-tRNA(Ala) deacylase AlaX